MSIIHTFDPESREIIAPERAVNRIDKFPETVIAAFSQKFMTFALSMFKPEQISSITISGMIIPVYKFTYNNQEIGLYHTLLGGPASGAQLEEIIAMGAKRVLFFGSCGSLDKSVTGGRLIIPEAAYRDEGTSYHYTPASDFIEIKSSDRLSRIFDELGVNYVRTKTWTTDSFYRETVNNMEARKRDGCTVVEMECASVMAIGQFRGIDIYQFLYTADCIDGGEWDTGLLGKMPDDLREYILRIAAETAVRL